MANPLSKLAPDVPVVDPPRQPRDSLVLPAICFLLATIVGCDICAIELSALDTLRIPFPHAVRFAFLIVPAAGALIWFQTRRRYPVLGLLIPVLVSFSVLFAIP